MAETRLKFIMQQATVGAGTWAAIGQHKLDQMKLDTGPFEIQGVLPPAAFHRDSGQDSVVTFDQVDIPSSGAERGAADTSQCSIAVPCSVHALNNLEDTVDGALCASLLSEACEQLRDAIISGSAFQNVQQLFRCLLIVHANLKTHVYTYAFAFPFLKLAQPFKLLSCVPLASAVPEHTATELATLYTNGEPVLVHHLQQERTGAATALEVLPWSNLKNSSEGSITWPEGATVVMADTSSHPGVLGWPLRNLCALLAAHFPGKVVDIVAIRMERGAVSLSQSLLLKIQLPEQPHPQNAAAAGWHSTVVDQEGHRVPKMVQVPLAGSLDPEVQAHEAMKLNLQLMTWRAAPDINLSAISRLHCLVLGCGTLGCEVARTLVSWGVQRITLVDNGKVAFSNPARQSLFTVQDCKDGGALKVEAAAAALASIAPKLDVQAVAMSIPMPGHPPVPSELAETRQAIRQLHDLIEAADAVFLLTDSRESRWLPTLQAAASRTLLINSALAFDSWVTMRHGLPNAPGTAQPTSDEAATAATTSSCSQAQATVGSKPERLGCYFCNDVVAPANSLARRSMDQQCTVVRPGLARVAAAHAVEMLAALSQHEAFGAAPVGDARSGGVLGGVPHMLRGTFMGFEQTHMHGVATAACSACGDGVVNAYQQDSEDFVMKVLQDQTYVEVVSGLQALRMHGNTSEGEGPEVPDEAGAGLGSDEDDWLAV